MDFIMFDPISSGARGLEYRKLLEERKQQENAKKFQNGLAIEQAKRAGLYKEGQQQAANPFAASIKTPAAQQPPSNPFVGIYDKIKAGVGIGKQRPPQMQPPLMMSGAGNQNAPQMQGQPMQEAMQEQEYNPMRTDGGVVTSTGQRPVRPAQPVVMPKEEDMDNALLRYAYDFGVQTGDFSHFNEAFEATAKNRQAASLAEKQQTAALAGQLMRLPPEQRKNAAEIMLGQMGLAIEDSALSEYLNDPQAMEAYLRAVMQLGDLDEAAKQVVKTQASYDEFRPYQTDDLGGRIGIFDPQKGAYTNFEGKSVDPNNIYNQTQMTRRESMGNATSLKATALNNASAQNIARIKASTTIREGDKDRYIKQEELKLRRELGRLKTTQDALTGVRPIRDGGSGEEPIWGDE